MISDLWAFNEQKATQVLYDDNRQLLTFGPLLQSAFSYGLRHLRDFYSLVRCQLLDAVDTLNYEIANRRIFDVKVVFEFHKFHDDHYFFIQQS